MITLEEIQEAKLKGIDRIFRMLPLSRIRRNPNEPRRHRDAEFDARLTANLRKQGIKNPLLVTPSSDEGYVNLVGGGTRHRCAEAAGLDEAPCQILLTEMTEVERRLLGLSDNLLRNDLSLIDVADEASAIMGLGDISQKKIAEMLDCSDAQISSALKLLTLPQEILDMVRGKGTPAGRALAGSVALKLAALGEHPAEQMEMAKQWLRKELSREQIDRQVAKLVKKRGYNRKAAEEPEEEGKTKRTTIKVDGANMSFRVAFDKEATPEELYTLTGRMFRAAQAAKEAGDITVFGAKLA